MIDIKKVLEESHKREKSLNNKLADLEKQRKIIIHEKSKVAKTISKNVLYRNRIINLINEQDEYIFNKMGN